MRASVATEMVGIPSVSLLCEGFVDQGESTSAGLGMPNLPSGVIPGHVDLQSKAELEKNIKAVTLNQIVKALMVQPEEAKAASEPGPRGILFKGTFEEVNKFFYETGLSDGLPIVPPTVKKVQEFLEFTDRSPDEVIGVLLPDNRQATIWNVAVNGVMAGCRPEYMPVLIALAEAMADPTYGVEHSGNTPGSETLITINGLIIKDLKFNYEQGVLRDGFQANTTIGRFWRLMLRNVAGFLPHRTDKATYGNTWRVVLAENEDAVARIGWEPMSVDRGFKLGDNVVTIARYTGGGVILSVCGSNAEEVLPYIADSIVGHIKWELAFTVAPWPCFERPHLILSPIIAETIAKSGWSKKDVKQYLYEHARMPAWKVEKILGPWTNNLPGSPTLCDLVKSGITPKQFCESSDPNRMVPIVCSPDDFQITVSGDPGRSNAYIFIHNGFMGMTTSKLIKLPDHWNESLKRAK